MTETATTPSRVDRLRARFGVAVTAVTLVHGRPLLEVPPAHWLEVATALRDEPEFAYAQAMDICGIDYFSYGEGEMSVSESATHQGFGRGITGTTSPGRFDWADRPQDVKMERRFAVVLQLLSIVHNERLMLRCYCDDETAPRVPSLTGVWPGLNWFEREAFDLYGIIFDGHPDLRRILTDYGFVGHPFRKDFPLIGNVEVRYDEKQKRVIYEPVTSVVPRTTVAKVIRHSQDLATARGEEADDWQHN